MEEESDRCSKHVQEEGELPLHEYVVASRLVKNRAYHRALLCCPLPSLHCLPSALQLPWCACAGGLGLRGVLLHHLLALPVFQVVHGGESGAPRQAPQQVGLIYGSVTEDLMTSIRIHSRGWKSVFYAPFPPSFIGCVPSTSEDALTMRKRWHMGILEILFSPYSPFLVKHTKGLSLIQRLIYMALLSYLAFFIYSILPSLAILGKRKIYPEVLDPYVAIPLSLSMFIVNVHIHMQNL